MWLELLTLEKKQWKHDKHNWHPQLLERKSSSYLESDNYTEHSNKARKLNQYRGAYWTHDE